MQKVCIFKVLSEVVLITTKNLSNFSSKTAVIGNTNAVLVYTNLEDSPIYNNEEAHNFVRDVYWDSDNSFYTVAWDKKLRHHFTDSSN